MSVALIVGGTSGLGLELAKKLQSSYTVHITGRHDPVVVGLLYHQLDLSLTPNFFSDIEALVSSLPTIDLFVYAAGFYQEGTISDLSDIDMLTMQSVGLTAPMFLLNRVLKKQNELSEFIAITSTSQWTPRKLEPVYTAVKAGLGMLAHSLSEDERVHKVLVAGPAGMDSAFWKNAPRDTTTFLKPEWVAEQVLLARQEGYRYKFIKIMREPQRVEVVETKQ